MKWILFAAIVAVWLGPLAAGLLDTLCWFAVNQQCTPVPWNAEGGSRGLFAIYWTVLVAFPAVLVLGAIGTS